MKDITKGDLLEAIDSLPRNIMNEKRRIAQMILPDIQNYMHGSGSVFWNTKDGRLKVILRIERTEKYKHEILSHNHS